jgi:hypothetical protein
VINRLFPLIGFGFLSLSSASGATPIQFLKDEQLKEAPLPGAAVKSAVKSGTKGESIERKGFWLKVQLPTGSGWVKLSSVRIGAQKLGGQASLNSGRGAIGNIVNTSGTRGLSPETLAAAQANPEEFERLKSQSAPADEVQRFRAASGLVSRRVPYIQNNAVRVDASSPTSPSPQPAAKDSDW